MLKIRTDQTTEELDTIALRVSQPMLLELDEIARISSRTRAKVIIRAIEAYLGSQGQDIRAIADAQNAIQAGQFADLDQVLKDLDHIVRGGLA